MRRSQKLRRSLRLTLYRRYPTPKVQLQTGKQREMRKKRNIGKKSKKEDGDGGIQAQHREHNRLTQQTTYSMSTTVPTAKKEESFESKSGPTLNPRVSSRQQSISIRNLLLDRRFR